MGSGGGASRVGRCRGVGVDQLRADGAGNGPADVVCLAAGGAADGVRVGLRSEAKCEGAVAAAENDGAEEDRAAFGAARGLVLSDA